MQPLNYSIDVKTPMESAVGGLQVGLGLSELNAKRQEADLVRQDAERKRQRQMQMQGALATLSRNPAAGARDYSQVMVAFPEIAEHLKKGYDILQPEQQKEDLAHATQVYAAINSGQPDVAVNILKDRGAAQRNGGREDMAKAAETMAQLIEMSPDTARTSAGLFLSSIVGADKFATMFPALGKEARDTELQPSALTAAQQDAKKKTADANVAEITARYGEQNAITDLAKKGWDIKKIEADIGLGKENSRIAAMNAATNRMNAGTSAGQLGVAQTRLKHDLDEAIIKRAETVREKVSEITSARTSIDNMLNTADRILKHPGLQSATGSIAGRLPSYTQNAADFDALVESLSSQAFTAQIPAMKGLGALSDAEGKKLQAALQSFDLKQNPEQFAENIREAQRLVLKARKNLTTKFGMPDSVPDTPSAAAPTSAGKSTDDILRELGINPGA